MKKLIISIFLLFIVIYPPHSSNAEHTEEKPAQESILNYLTVKSEILQYQLIKKLKGFNQLYDSLKLKNKNHHEKIL